jgi:hypothetical protein
MNLKHLLVFWVPLFVSINDFAVSQPTQSTTVLVGDPLSNPVSPVIPQAFPLGSSNLALNQATTASSVFSAATSASKATDSDLTSKWMASSQSVPQWLIVDLGASCLTVGVETTWGETATWGYSVDATLDSPASADAFWLTPIDQSTNTVSNQTYDNLFSTNIWARYIRLNCVRASSNGCSVLNFAVYGWCFTSTPTPSTLPAFTPTPTRPNTPTPVPSLPTSVPTPTPTPLPTCLCVCPSPAPTPVPTLAPTSFPTTPVPVPPSTPQPTAPIPTPTPTPIHLTTNVALGKPATASTTFSSSYAPALAFDGSLQTRWCPVNGSNNQWLQVDLLSAYTISQSQVTFESNGTVGATWRYTVYGSVDNSAWTPLVDRTQNTQTYQTLQDLFSFAGRFFRIVVVIPAVPHWASIEDWSLFA